MTDVSWWINVLSYKSLLIGFSVINFFLLIVSGYLSDPLSCDRLSWPLAIRTYKMFSVKIVR